MKGMLDERSRSGEHTADVSDAANKQSETAGSPAKRVMRQRPAMRPDESSLNMSRQSEMIDQVGRMDASHARIVQLNCYCL